MGLIINDKIQKMLIGYPTVSDKYNVSGGIFTGSAAVGFGTLVQKTSTPGYFKTAAGATAVTDICGFILATNVKLAENWPGSGVQVNPGEAFNLMVDGFIAVEIDDADTDYITPNAQMCVTLSTGKITTSDNYSASTVPYLPNCVFTGVYENQGTAASPKIVAEVYVK